MVNYAALCAQHAEALLEVFSEEFPDVQMTWQAWRALEGHISRATHDLLGEVLDEADADG